MSHLHSRHRLNLFIERDHAKRLDELSAKKGVSKSSIVAAALASWLSPDAGDQREAAMAKRLDRLSRQFEKLERDQNILIETLALYVRYFLTVSTPVPEAHQDAAKHRARRASSSSSNSSAATCCAGAAWCVKWSRRSSPTRSGWTRR
ncbi:hypothetical protein [Aeromonas hydrophila]|uniref:hypothetical protein n=1 Tax=Aeromonas hydrophila TaxID=644 RepID=UPI003EC575EC